MIQKIKCEVEEMRNKTGLSISWILSHLGINRSTYYNWLKWKKREPLGFVHPLKPLLEEELAVIEFAKLHRGIGYKKLTYMMIDSDVAYLSPSQVYRILSKANLLDRWGNTVGAGKEYIDKPTKPDEQWHMDIMYIKVLGRWCFLISVLDGYSRYVVSHKVMMDMTSKSVSMFMQEVLDKTGVKTVKLVTDNGSQLLSKDLREVLMSGDIQHIRIRRNHPESNGKIERFHGTARQEALRPNSPATIMEVEKVLSEYIEYYNNERLHSSIDYIRPVDYYRGEPDKIRLIRADKLTRTRERRMMTNREFNRMLKEKRSTS